AASKRARGVVNVSSGFFGYDALLEQAIDRALHRGTIVVAAVGNDRESGSRSFVPASLPHVLTVGATNQSDRVAFFSNRSAALDPGGARREGAAEGSAGAERQRQSRAPPRGDGKRHPPLHSRTRTGTARHDGGS